MNPPINAESEVAFLHPDQIISIQARKISKLEEENDQLRFEAGYLDDLSKCDYEPTAYAWGPGPLEDALLAQARLWLYRNLDKVLLVLGFCLAGGSMVLAGQRLGWW